ncbi:MAG: LLM class flavin-dependent oxidoreductase [Alphaproteobacteria bacterium]|nr:LLM class flavin-dependent oxidoreductase [Alphaproteobacteria bacterium]
MDFGYVTPTRPPLGTAENTLALAAWAESLGFASVAVPDHVVPPKDFGPTYPYTENDRMGWGPSGEVLEMMALLAFLAGATKKLKLITGVMVVPLRHPLLVAKQLATLDVLSQGRIIAGCGVGWESVEFATIGAPPFAERGRVTDEYLRLFKEV